MFNEDLFEINVLDPLEDLNTMLNSLGDKE